MRDAQQINLPFFYYEKVADPGNTFVMDEATSKHIVQVLRMQTGEQLQLTDGKGNLLTAEITDNNKKRCAVTSLEILVIDHPPFTVTIAISLIKNVNRFEWFLEKATEIGVNEIIPLICERTEKQNFRYDRMKTIVVSAMLQSQQCWLPVLHEPKKIETVLPGSPHQQKFIAHCMEEEKRNLADMVNENLSSKIILIGPEGDFTKNEIEMAVQHHFIPVALGNNRLRTETAGIVGATLLTQL